MAKNCRRLLQSLLLPQLLIPSAPLVRLSLRRDRPQGAQSAGCQTPPPPNPTPRLFLVPLLTGFGKMNTLARGAHKPNTASDCQTARGLRTVLPCNESYILMPLGPESKYQAVVVDWESIQVPKTGEGLQLK